MTRTTLPPHDEIRPTTPLRLGVDAVLAIPDGSMRRPVADWPRVTTGRPEELATGTTDPWPLRGTNPTHHRQPRGPIWENKKSAA